MALHKCYECENSVSTDALCCPNCGAPTKNMKPIKRSQLSNKALWVIALTAGVAIIVGLIIYYQSDSDYRVAMTSNDIELISKSIDSINDPVKLYKISERCGRKAEALGDYKEEGKIVPASLAWRILSLHSLERIIKIEKDQKNKN
jgi:hypothetical protein